MVVFAVSCALITNIFLLSITIKGIKELYLENDEFERISTLQAVTPLFLVFAAFQSGYYIILKDENLNLALFILFLVITPTIILLFFYIESLISFKGKYGVSYYKYKSEEKNGEKDNNEKTIIEKQNSNVKEEGSPRIESEEFKLRKEKIVEKINSINNSFSDVLSDEEKHFINYTTINKLESVEKVLFKEELNDNMLNMFSSINDYLDDLYYEKHKEKEEKLNIKVDNISEIFKKRT